MRTTAGIKADAGKNIADISGKPRWAEVFLLTHCQA